MMQDDIDDTGVRVQLRLGGKERAIVIPEARVEQVRGLTRTVLREPFNRRTWTELTFFLLSGLLVAAGLTFVAFSLFAGIALLITFVGVVIIAATVRGSRGIGGFNRTLARSLLGEEIEDPEPFVARPGFFGWLQSALRDRPGWRAMAYLVLKAPLVLFGVWFALGVWVSAINLITYPVWGGGSPVPSEFGVVSSVFGHRNFGYNFGVLHGALIVAIGVALFFAAPWATRLVVVIDRRLMRLLLGPDPVTTRVRSLEHARAQTVDASAATLRQIERNLHDGTQAQLVTVAMRLGLAKEKLAQGDDADLEQVRQLVDEAHRGAKEAIVELRDLARGIHPPALDIGLEGALSTLAARSTVPTELTVVLSDRPTPAIETIAYFCVAELLANVAQHAEASRATISCVQHGGWLRIVVRDDGKGGAQLSRLGSSSSGLSGLSDRVHAVDGHFEIASPAGGPTVVTVDLPLHA